MPDHDHIYKNEVELYELLISKEDYQHNIIKTIQRIIPELEHVTALDIGAGTGRISRLLAPLVHSLTATDASEAMLECAVNNLNRLQLNNWQTCIADNHKLPIDSHTIDLLTAGWTICYSSNSYEEQWKDNLALIMGEIQRVVRPSATVIIFENGGAGYDTPHPPDYLHSYFDELVNEYSFSHEYIRTDFQFQTVDEAEQIFRFFFGDEFADRVQSMGQTIVPSCTGVWWRTY